MAHLHKKSTEATITKKMHRVVLPRAGGPDHLLYLDALRVFGVLSVSVCDDVICISIG